MQVRRSWLIVATITLVLAGGAVFVQRQLARNKDRASYPAQSEARQSPDKQSSAPHKLPNNPDGLEFERTVVPDAPFTATLITETNQRMPDGSASSKTITSLIYRDRKGRTRRDWLADPVSPNALESAVVKRSVINDPVTGFTYSLDHRANVAQRSGFVGMPPQSATSKQPRATQGQSRDQMLPLPSSAGTDNKLLAGGTADSLGQTPESLGSREIEGVLAEGTRVSVTLPAKADNEQTVELVAERWYAPSIHTPILVKRTDSRAGESTYRLTNIKRAEPAANLFVVPGNYRITDATGREVSGSPKTPQAQR